MELTLEGMEEERINVGKNYKKMNFKHFGPLSIGEQYLYITEEGNSNYSNCLVCI